MKISTPESAGFSSERLARIRSFMQGYVDQQKLAGLVTMIARRGMIVHAECIGMMDIEAGKPMQLDTIFRVYSMTKAITSVAVMMLYEQGHFQLYDSIAEFIPEFKSQKVFVRGSATSPELTDAEREITIRDLLTHTSGLTYDFLEESPVGAMYREADLVNSSGSLQEMVKKLTRLPLVFQPGSAWRYSVATDVLGRLVEVVSGMPFERFLEDAIFKPLGMPDTAFFVPQEKLDRFAAIYGPGDGGGLKRVEAPLANLYAKPPSIPLGGGGLVGTAPDYMRFLQMMLNGGELDGVRLLGRKTVDLMTINHLPQHCLPYTTSTEREVHYRGYGFGLGFKVLMNVAQSQTVGSIGEYGWGGMANTTYWVDPKEELIGIAMLQFLPDYHYPHRAQFKALTYQALVD
jgi:CubicO group peptidase (beta-lactamase class C family)